MDGIIGRRPAAMRIDARLAAQRRHAQGWSRKVHGRFMARSRSNVAMPG